MRDTAAERCRGEARPRRARPHEAPRLHMDDYYARAREFRAWLTARHQYLDELTSTEARRAFREFADAWNAGSLDDAYYTGTARGAHSRYRWAWARAAPCAAADVERGSERRAARAAAQAWLDEHAPRATGREALLAKKKERAASHRAMAERRQLDDDVADGLSEDALLGTDSSFAAALAERERAAARRAEARKEATYARDARLAARQRKEADTMAQLRQMAAKRYG
ncbi:Hypothetical protein MSYG_0501 [Malassezia sympodialis ATCC 42132]|uniref:Uncharacterized protein n=1 Tax=Malassezia sympodialis (strain ATCC 42132) TaxID=1230383 RepID=A0A1M8A140_MALS4|nr:Hypothetical protein MSYG_0501 [Malassezia sympodialis ATCC 42132]